jgi:hypothetical protein
VPVRMNPLPIRCAVYHRAALTAGNPARPVLSSCRGPADFSACRFSRIGPVAATAGPARADRPAQLGPAPRPLVHGERLAEGEFSRALPAVAVEESAEKEIVSASELKDPPQPRPPDGVLAKGPQPLLRSRLGLSAGPSRRAGAISLRFPGWRRRRGSRCLLGSTPTCEVLGRLKGTVLRNRFLLCRRGRLEGRAGAVRLPLRCPAGFGLRVPILGAIHDPDLLGRPPAVGNQDRRRNRHSLYTMLSPPMLEVQRTK